MELKVKQTDKSAKLPSYGHKGDAGMDLFSVNNCILEPGKALPVPTGIKIAVPKGYVALIWDKSGISLNGIHRLAGVVDCGYRGEIKVVMINLSDKPFVIDKGMKIAQLLVQPVQEVEIKEVNRLDNTDRGEKGFGSTGKY